MAYVGDGHQQAPSRAASGLGEDRVVEVLSVLPIDGHEGRAAQIHTARDRCLRHLLGKPCHLLFHGLGPVFLQIMGAQHHGQLPFVIEVPRGRKHRLHFAPARATALGVGGQAQAHPAARGRAQGPAGTHQELSVDPRMGRVNHPHAPAIEKLAHQGLVGALEDLGHGALGLAVPARARNAHEHLVPIHS